MIRKNSQICYLQFHLGDDVEDVWCDVESLFTNIPVEEIINCIVEQIYV